MYSTVHQYEDMRIRVYKLTVELFTVSSVSSGMEDHSLTKTLDPRVGEDEWETDL